MLVHTIFIGLPTNSCRWTISYYCRCTHRTGVVGEWLQSCDGQTGTAGSGAIDDAASWAAGDEIADDDSITLWGERRRPGESDAYVSSEWTNRCLSEEVHLELQ